MELARQMVEIPVDGASHSTVVRVGQTAVAGTGDDRSDGLAAPGAAEQNPQRWIRGWGLYLLTTAPWASTLEEVVRPQRAIKGKERT
jgi:hypothetical protein